LVKLIGTEKTMDQQKLTSLFRAFLMTRVKTYIAQAMRSMSINIFEIDERLTEFSEALHQLLIPDFADYGVALERFFVTNVAKPDGDRQYEKFKDLHFRQYADVAEAKLRQQTDLIYAQTEAQKTVIAAQALATKRAQEGYTYQQERGFDVAEKVAQNEAIGEFTNLGVGFGTMAGIGGAMGGMVGNMMQDTMGTVAPIAQIPTTVFCENCGAKLAPGTAFCDECGTAVVDSGTCHTCGYKFERPGKFCPKCGAKREG